MPERRSNGPPDLEAHWLNRRIHAYVALVWIILQTFMWIYLSISYPEAFSLLYSVVGFSYMVPSAILTAYYGGSSYQDFLNRSGSGSHQHPSSPTSNRRTTVPDRSGFSSKRVSERHDDRRVSRSENNNRR